MVRAVVNEDVIFSLINSILVYLTLSFNSVAANELPLEIKKSV